MKVTVYVKKWREVVDICETAISEMPAPADCSTEERAAKQHFNILRQLAVREIKNAWRRHWAEIRLYRA